MVYNVLHDTLHDLKMGQESLATVDASTTAYAITLLMFIFITIITLTNHLRGRHDTCRRNLAVSAVLASIIIAASSFRPRLPAPSTVQTLETVAYLTMLLTPLLLLLSVFVELNNQTGGAVKKRHETTGASLRNIPAPGPATSQYRNELSPATTYSRQEMRPDQPPPPQAPAQKPSAPPTPLPTIYRPHSPTSTAWNIARNTATSPKPAKQPGKTAARKKRPKIEDIIHSPEYAQPLGRILVKTLHEGVRYNGKLYRLHLTFIRQQDIIYIWQLGKKRKKQPITERARHRLNNLQLVKLSKKVRQGEGGAQTAEIAELTEKGWAARNAIAKAAQKILEKKAAEIAAPAA